MKIINSLPIDAKKNGKFLSWMTIIIKSNIVEFGWKEMCEKESIVLQLN